jgi:LGFP repeat
MKSSSRVFPERLSGRVAAPPNCSDFRSVSRGCCWIAIKLIVVALCSSMVVAQDPYYYFVVSKFHIDKTRAWHKDTDVVSFAIKVGDQTLDPQIRDTGDVDDGDHVLNMAFGPMHIAGPDTQVAFNYQIANRGNQSYADIEKKLKEGIDKLFLPKALTVYAGRSPQDAGAGSSGSSSSSGGCDWLCAAAIVGGTVIWPLLTPDCDGPVASDQVVATPATLNEWTGGTGTHSETRFYPGSDSAVGCGGNSNYSVTWYVVRSEHKLYGLIAEKWMMLGGEQSPLGLVLNDESDAFGGGRYNDFQNGSISFSQQTGAHAVYGDIGKKWAELGREHGFGYPLTDEQGASDGGRYNEFQDGKYIYWSPQTGAHAVYGKIAQKWVELGREDSPLGYPVADEEPAPNGRISRFQHGAIFWSPQTGRAVVQ